MPGADSYSGSAWRHRRYGPLRPAGWSRAAALGPERGEGSSQDVAPEVKGGAGGVDDRRPQPFRGSLSVVR